MQTNLQLLHDAIARDDSTQIHHLLSSDSTLSSDAYLDALPPLILAAKDAKVNSVQELLTWGMNANSLDLEGYSALHYAVQKDHPVEIAALLISAGANISIRSGIGGSEPIHMAASENNAQAISLLLRHGARINSSDAHGLTPLLHAAQNGSAAAVYVLMLQGADASLRDRNGYTPLFQAAQSRGDSGETVGVLLRYGAQLDIHASILLGQTLVVRGMLAATPDIVANDPNVLDFVTTAVWTEKHELVAILTEHGLNVNAATRMSLPLLEAVRRIPAGVIDGSLFEIVRTLTAAGAKPELTSPIDQLSAIDWAKQHNPPILSLLQHAKDV